MRENLRRARRDAGMSQEDIAAELDMSASTYQLIESGEITPREEVWDAIEQLLGERREWLKEEDGYTCW